jgi:hypothetical protein
MVLDAAPKDTKRGVEEQTRKRCEVCRLRDVPIITFFNKLDGEGSGRRELARLLRGLQPGDVVTVTRIDRLARSTGDPHRPPPHLMPARPCDIYATSGGATGSNGRDGDRINAVLAAAGYNFGLLLRWLEWLLRALMRLLHAGAGFAALTQQMAAPPVIPSPAPAQGNCVGPG